MLTPISSVTARQVCPPNADHRNKDNEYSGSAYYLPGMKPSTLCIFSSAHLTTTPGVHCYIFCSQTMDLRITNLLGIVALGGSRAGCRRQVCLSPKSGLWPLLFPSPSHVTDSCCVRRLESWTWGCAGHTYSFWDSSLRAGDAEAWRCWVTGPGSVSWRGRAQCLGLPNPCPNPCLARLRPQWSWTCSKTTLVSPHFHSTYKRRKCSRMN